MAFRISIIASLILAISSMVSGLGDDYNALYTTTGGYHGNGLNPKTIHNSWMTGLKDDITIAELSIPGTHDAGCESVHSAASSDAAVTQDATVFTQLIAGVRFLDLRIINYGSEWFIYHGDWEFRRIHEVLEDIRGFLYFNPGETVLVRLSVNGRFLGGTTTGDVHTFLNNAWPAIKNQYGHLMWPNTFDKRPSDWGPIRSNFSDMARSPAWDFGAQYGIGYYPTLGEVRGKMVMFLNPDPGIIDSFYNREAKGVPYASGLTYINHIAEDNVLPLRTAFPPPHPFGKFLDPADPRYDGDRPVTPIENPLYYAMSTRDDYKNANRGEKQALDWKHIRLASADKSPLHLYATGINIAYSFGRAYPDTHAEDMNRWLLNTLNNVKVSSEIDKTGIVLMDYPGPALLDSIIALNLHYVKKDKQQLVYNDLKQYAARLPFDESVYNPSEGNKLIAQKTRTLIKNRMPTCKFNTLVTEAAGNAKLQIFLSSIKDVETDSLSFSFGPFDNKRAHSVFQSYEGFIADKINKLEIEKKLRDLLLNPAMLFSPKLIKSEFEKVEKWNELEFVVYFQQIIYGLPRTGVDFENNVVWGQHIATFNYGNIFANWIVAAYPKRSDSNTGQSSSGLIHYFENEEDTSLGSRALTRNDLGSGLMISEGAPFAPRELTTSEGVSYVTKGSTGIELRHGNITNGGPSATRMHQWTLVVDLKLPHYSGFRSLMQIDTLDHSSNADVFISPDGGIGNHQEHFGKLSTEDWHRVVVAVDATHQRLMSLYIDGALVGSIPTRTFTTTVHEEDGLIHSDEDRWSLGESVILFGDENGESGEMYIGGFQLLSYKMTDMEVAKLGGVKGNLEEKHLDIIPNNQKIVTISRAKELQLNADGLEQLTDSAHGVVLKWMKGETLQSSSRLNGPYNDVHGFESPYHIPDIRLYPERFFRIRETNPQQSKPLEKLIPFNR